MSIRLRHISCCNSAWVGTCIPTLCVTASYIWYANYFYAVECVMMLQRLYTPAAKKTNTKLNWSMAKSRHVYFVYLQSEFIVLRFKQSINYWIICFICINWQLLEVSLICNNSNFCIYELHQRTFYQYFPIINVSNCHY